MLKKVVVRAVRGDPIQLVNASNVFLYFFLESASYGRLEKSATDGKTCEGQLLPALIGRIPSEYSTHARYLPKLSKHLKLLENHLDLVHSHHTYACILGQSQPPDLFNFPSSIETRLRCSFTIQLPSENKLTFVS